MCTCVCVCVRVLDRDLYPILPHLQSYNVLNLYPGASGSRAKSQLLPSCDGLPDKGEELGQRKKPFFTGPSGRLP